MARPSSYTKAKGDAICEGLAIGKSLRKICEGEGMPDEATVYRWIDSDAELRDRYARARATQAERYAEDIVDIADNARDANIARLQVDARKWVASKLLPKKYGDRQEIELSGSVDVGATEKLRELVKDALGPE